MLFISFKLSLISSFNLSTDLLISEEKAFCASVVIDCALFAIDFTTSKIDAKFEFAADAFLAAVSISFEPSSVAIIVE